MIRGSNSPPARGGKAPVKGVPPAAYYKQLYDTGGFSLETRVWSVFVCFNDAPSLQWFFTFEITGYDERYANADNAGGAVAYE
jgi:hypothetical protein